MGITSAIMVPHPPLIIPEIGRGKENGIEKTIHAYDEAARQLAEHKPETIVLISPHQILYSDYFHISPGNGAKGDFGRFMAGQVKMEVSYDTEFVKELCALADERDIPAGTMGERDKSLDHGTMVPLYFINKYWKDYKLVRIGLSGMPLAMHYELGQCIKMVADKLGRNVAVIASGDLSHKLTEDGPYGYSKDGPEYGRRIMDVMERASFNELFDFSEYFWRAPQSADTVPLLLWQEPLTKERWKQGGFHTKGHLAWVMVYAHMSLRARTADEALKSNLKIYCRSGLPVREK